MEMNGASGTYSEVVWCLLILTWPFPIVMHSGIIIFFFFFFSFYTSDTGGGLMNFGD